MPYITKAQLREIKKVAEIAKMEGFGGGLLVAGQRDDECLDDFVRRYTRLWRETWIITPLEDIVKSLEK